jgi:hypothetical protein
MQMALLFLKLVALFRVEANVMFDAEGPQLREKKGITKLLTSRGSDEVLHNYIVPGGDLDVG